MNEVFEKIETELKEKSFERFGNVGMGGEYARENGRMNNYVELKPCPFCGGKAETINFHDVFEDTYKIYIRCEQCKSQTPEVDCTIKSGGPLQETNQLEGIAGIWNSRTIQEGLQKYMEIGTVEACRAAVEKQMAKKPTPFDYKKYMDVVENAIFLRGSYWCPNCKHVVRSGVYCANCGQKLDWSDEK